MQLTFFKQLSRYAVLAAALLVTGTLTALEQPVGPPAAPATILAVTPAVPERHITLAEAIAQANARNLDIQVIAADIAKAKADYHAAWGALLPTLDSNMTLTHADHEDRVESANAVMRQQNTLTGSVTTAVPLINAPLWASVSLSELGILTTELGTENARQQLLYGVAQSFYAALTAESLIAVQQASLQAAERHLDVAQLKLSSGAGGKLDVLRLSSELAQIQGDLLTAKKTYANARDALATLIGAKEPPLPIADDTPLLGGLSPQILAARDVRERRDMRTAQKAEQLAAKQVDLVWLKFLPSLNASWQLTHSFSPPSGFGSSDRTRWNALLALSVPLYRESRYGELDGARALLWKARLQKDSVAAKAVLDLKTKHRNYTSALDALAITEQQVAFARDALALAETVYRAGAGTSLDVTDASRALRQAEVGLAIKRFAVESALIDLVNAAGEDLTRLADAPSSQ